MKKTLLLICCIVTCVGQFAKATTVGFGPVPTARTVVDSLGSTIGTSSLAWVGNFTSEGFSFNPSLSITANVSAISIAGGWKQFGLDTVSQTPDAGVVLPGVAMSSTGKLGGSISDQNSGATKADYFNTKNLYVWLFNATTVGSATEMGIFRSTDATVAWLFPTNNNGVGDNLTYSTTTGGAPTMLAIGGTGSAPAGQMKLIAAVPEPTVLALGGVAGLGMLASRKRRQRK